jgi:hypothetical protein
VARRAPLALAALAILGAGSVALSASAGRSLQPTTGIVAPPPFTLTKWNPDTDNLVPAQGTVMSNGSPVAGARVRVDNYDVPGATDKAGHFVYLADATLLQRHVVTITDASYAKVAGQALSSAAQSALMASQASINVAYAVHNLKVSRNGAGDPVVSGQITKTDGSGPPAVGLLTYQLTGTITDSNGKPVSGAQVSTRTLDRDYWTVSTESDSSGRYDSLFTASAEVAGNPVPFTVRVSKGETVYQFLPQEFVDFQRLKSARLDIRLPPTGYAFALPTPHSYPGALYAGTVVGVTSGTSSIRPVSAMWPDRSGRFTITLPKNLAGKTVSIWEGKLNLFSVAEAKPGGPVDLQGWPSTLPSSVPRGLATVTLK